VKVFFSNRRVGQRVSPTSRLKATVLLLMALSVLVWGTTYKLSLYKSSAEQYRTPAAKLCTRGSEAAKNNVDASVHEVPSRAAVPVATSVELLNETERRAHVLPVEPPRPRAFLAVRYAPALFLRPPPSI
jgi:hypothetical protein